MLTVVLLLRESVDEDVDEKIGHFSQQWLTEGFKLNFAVCSMLLYAAWFNAMNTHWSLVHA